VALTDAGQVFTWGNNESQLGNNESHIDEPVELATLVEGPLLGRHVVAVAAVGPCIY